MLDRKFVIENAEAVKSNCRNRNVTANIDQLVELETSRRNALQRVQELNTQANAESKKIGQAKDSDERQQLIEAARVVREQKDAAQHEHDQLEQHIHEIELAIPNMAHPDCPIGEDDKSNLELGRGKACSARVQFQTAGPFGTG